MFHVMLIRNESAHFNVFGVKTGLTMCENVVTISGFDSLSQLKYINISGDAGQVRVRVKRELQRPLLDDGIHNHQRPFCLSRDHFSDVEMTKENKLTKTPQLLQYWHLNGILIHLHWFNAALMLSVQYLYNMQIIYSDTNSRALAVHFLHTYMHLYKTHLVFLCKHNQLSFNKTHFINQQHSLIKVQI